MRSTRQCPQIRKPTAEEDDAADHVELGGQSNRVFGRLVRAGYQWHVEPQLGSDLLHQTHRIRSPKDSDHKRSVPTESDKSAALATQEIDDLLEAMERLADGSLCHARELEPDQTFGDTKRFLITSKLLRDGLR